MQTSDSIDELVTALVLAQGVIKPPKHNARGQARGGTYSYADLGAVFESVIKPLSDQGLAIVQAPTLHGEEFVLITRILHTSGQWIEASYPLPRGVSSQDMGSAITYGRRYSLCAILGIAAEEDDDGAKATTPARPASPKRTTTTEKGLPGGPVEKPPEFHDKGQAMTWYNANHGLTQTAIRPYFPEGKTMQDLTLPEVVEAAEKALKDKKEAETQRDPADLSGGETSTTPQAQAEPPPGEDHGERR